MSRKKKYFGTDGIRGLVGRGNITPDFIMRLGWAAGKVFASSGKKRILIGKDTRTSGYMFESALEAGLSAAGVDIILVGPMPTPAIAYLTQTFKADAGIVISASHNQFFDNGIKFFNNKGEKLDDEIEFAIEDILDSREITTVDSESLGKARRLNDAGGRYVEFCKSTCGHLDLTGMTIALDCANGATYDVGPKVFEELGATVIPIAINPDGININNACGSTKPARLQSKVLETGADLGIAFDGDGDRVAMVDHKGEIVDGDELIFIIASFLKKQGKLEGGVVGTLMSNLGFERALERADIEFVRAKVGDRYVLEEMNKRNWVIGGENSGHILCKNATSTGDGIVAALQVLKALVESGQKLYTAKSGMRKYPQEMINVTLASKVDVMSIESVQLAVKKAEEELGDNGRVLLRPSGTEPVVRVMVEGKDAHQVSDVCQALAEQVKTAVEEAIN